MDKKMNAYLDSLISEAVNLPSFANLPEYQKKVLAEKINTHFNKIIIGTIIDRLNPEQLNIIQSLNPQSIEIENKIEEYASQIPHLAEELEEKLKQAVESIKQNPQVIS